MLSRLIEWNLKFIAFTLPFQIVGIDAGAYPFSLTVLALGVLNVLLLVRGRFSSRVLAALAVFTGWCLVTAAFRHPPGTYLLSWFGLILVTAPICATYPQQISRKKLLSALVLGAVASFVLATYEVTVAVGSVPPIEDLFPLSIQPKTGDFLGFRRVKAGMEEPAHYAIYLVLIYAIIDHGQKQNINVPWSQQVKLLTPVFLLTTLSLSGVILFTAYLAVKTLGNLREVFQVWRLWRSGLLLLSAPIIVAGLVYTVRASGLDEVVVLFASRLDVVIDVVTGGTLTGSEGSRANTIPVMIDYWSSQSWIHLFMGEGYANYSKWLVQEFGYLNPTLSSFARGQINNIFAAIGISTGVVGVLLYLGFLKSIFSRSCIHLPASFIVTWLVMHFASGMLIGVLPWATLLAACIVFRKIPDRD
jgi:hypothetical protein